MAQPQTGTAWSLSPLLDKPPTLRLLSATEWKTNSGCVKPLKCGGRLVIAASVSLTGTPGFPKLGIGLVPQASPKLGDLISAPGCPKLGIGLALQASPNGDSVSAPGFSKLGIGLVPQASPKLGDLISAPGFPKLGIGFQVHSSKK